MKLFKKNKIGMTLIESLVAISVLMMAVMASLDAITNTMAISHIASDKAVAVFLAEEALDYARAIRDTNTVAENTNFIEPLDACIENRCAIDASVPISLTGSGVMLCEDALDKDACLQLHIVSENGQNIGYVHNYGKLIGSNIINLLSSSIFNGQSPTPSKFYRSLLLEGYGNQYVLTARVWWNDRTGVNREVRLQSTLFPTQ